MGIDTPEPPVPGDNCVRCDNVLWTPGNTPRFVPVTFSELIQCPGCPTDPPNGKWWFEQHPGIACYWLYVDSVYYMDMKLDPADSWIFVTSLEAPPNWEFFYSLKGLCASVFTNEYVACGLKVGSKDGTGVVDWPGV